MPRRPTGSRASSLGVSVNESLSRERSCTPRLLVGDEPLSALDVTVRAQILGLFDRLRQDEGMTIIMVSHDIGVVQNLCDRVVVMKDGRIVERGETSRVLHAPEADYTRALLAAIPSITPPGETPAEDRRDGRAPSSPA